MSLFNKPSPPKPKAVAPLPDENDPAVLRAKRLSILSAQNRGGRDSTVLASAGTDQLGNSPGGLQ